MTELLLLARQRVAAAAGRLQVRSDLLRLALFGGGLYFTAYQLVVSRARYPDGPPATVWLGLLLSLFIYFDLTPARSLTSRAAPDGAPGRPGTSSSGATRQVPHGWRLGGLFFAGSFTLFVLWRLPQLPFAGDYGLVVVAWAGAFLGLVMAAVPRAQFRPLPWARFWPAQRGPALTVAGLLLVAFGVRYWRLGTVPFALGGDEASQGLEALRVLRGEIGNPFATGWLGVPTMSFFFNAPTLALLGPTAPALRLPWVAVGTLTVWVTYGVTARLAGRRLALLTAALLATYHYHIHFSRLGSNQVADPLFAGLALFFLQRGLDRGRQLDWVLLGGVCGLAFYFYAGARFTPVLVLAVLGYRLLYDRGAFWRRHGTGVLWAFGAFLVVGAPMAQYAMRFPDEFNARVNAVGIFQSGWLAREVGIRGEPAWLILWDQFQRAFLAFNFFPDRTVWYGLRQPLLDPAFGVVLLFGLGVATVRALRPGGERGLLPMVAWWWGGVILGGMLTESPPSSMRLITLAVPTCFLVAFGSVEVVRLMRRVGAWAMAEGAFLAGLTLAFVAISLVGYFRDYSPQRLYGGQHAALATVVAPVLADLGPAYRPVFLGAPQMYWGFATLPFLLPDYDGVDVTEPLTAPVPASLVSAGRGAVFLFLPFRAAELAYVRETFPDGVRRAILVPGQSEPVLLYAVPPAPPG